jgi:hypothetical protein
MIEPASINRLTISLKESLIYRDAACRINSADVSFGKPDLLGWLTFVEM